MFHDIPRDMPRDGESNTCHSSSAEFKAQSQGPLAEFQALRQEIESRRNIQHNFFALQLTAAAVIFSFALSVKGRSEFLLMIPISSFMLCAEYVDQENGMNNSARYIKEELGRRVPGGLNWESWLHNPANVSQHELFRRVAMIVAFPAIAIGALAWYWVVPNVFSSGYHLDGGVAVSGGVQAAIIIMMIIGVIASLSNIVIILRIPHKPKTLIVCADCHDYIHASPRSSSVTELERAGARRHVSIRP